MIDETILHYKIIEKLGEGGMGEVYKAQDTKLDRFVALKFLPSQLTATEDAKARFIQEAKAASAMNHPNVCTIHDIQEYEGQLFIVMEFVDGKTLKDKKDHLSEKQILEIGIQTAEGLAAAHEKGIVHRDIKPENIMIRKDGIVQIMDFGLAKLFAPGDASRLTRMGTTMGTMGYMSPEQVQGLDVDHRTDIFSLGVVLYELLAGESPFKGMHETAIMYEIVNVDASPLSSVKQDIDPVLEEIILECLEKDKDDRCQSAKELAKNLRKIKRVSSGNKTSRFYQSQSFSSREIETANIKSGKNQTGIINYIKKNRIAVSLIALLVIILLFFAYSNFSRTSTSEFNEPIRFSFDIPGKSNPILFWPAVLNISPDGQSIAYTDLSISPSVIKIRSLNSFDSHTVRGTESGNEPVFINNNWLAFTSKERNTAMKVPISGGIPDKSHQTYYGNGYNFGTDASIVSTKDWSSGGIYYQKTWESSQESITKLDAENNEGAHINPYMLPGNEAAVFTIWSKDGTFDDSKIALVNIKTKEKKILSYNGVKLQGTYPEFISTPWGDFLLYSHSGSLYASAFDLSGLQVTGPEIKILDNISLNSQNGKAAYSVANGNNGTIVYIPGKIDTAKSFLMWIDKNGSEKKAVTVSAPFLSPYSISNSKGLVMLTGAAYKIGMYDTDKNKVTMLFDKGDNNQPMLTPDGSHFIFVSNFENDKYNIYLSRLDGVGGAKKIVTLDGGYPYISNLSPDGKYIMYSTYRKNSTIMIKDISSDSEAHELFKSASSLQEPSFSPDGKLIAYRSDEIDNKSKLFIRPFPINDVKIQVSIDEGIYPKWSHDGKGIYYRDGDNIIMAKIETSPELKVVSRSIACNSPRVSSTTSQSDYTITPDGRILVLKSAIDQSKPVTVNVITNWFSELKSKLVNAN